MSVLMPYQPRCCCSLREARGLQLQPYFQYICVWTPKDVIAGLVNV